jgi:hypothetical protein
MNQETCAIQIEELESNGWHRTPDKVFPMEKSISNNNPLNASEDSDLKLVIHGMYNQPQFAILLPDGGLLNFNVNTIQELVAFENSIDFYDPPF